MKLNKLSAQTLAEKQMQKIIGGECTCGCGCLYEDTGGSCLSANAGANKARGKFSAENKIAWCDKAWVSQNLDFD